MKSVSTMLPASTSSERRSVRKASAVVRCRRKFLRLFPGGYRDDEYVASDRGYKWETRLRWREALEQDEYLSLLKTGKFTEIAARAVRVEQSSPYSFNFSFEKMALRNAVKLVDGARLLSGLYEFLYGADKLEARFVRWVSAVASLPRRQTRVLTWPLVTVIGFLAQPSTHIFLKPTVTGAAAAAYGYDFQYVSRPSRQTYTSLLDFASTVQRDLRDLRPRDMIDIQSLLWVQGSEALS